MALTDLERVSVRHHLGYLQVGATNNPTASFPQSGQPGYAASVQYSIPRPVETLFIVEQAMNMILPIAEPRLRQTLGVLDTIEQKLIESLDRLAASKVDEITLRDVTPGNSEQDALEREHKRWAGYLADMLGVPFYAYSERMAPGVGMGAAARNVKVKNY